MNIIGTKIPSAPLRSIFNDIIKEGCFTSFTSLPSLSAILKTLHTQKRSHINDCVLCFQVILFYNVKLLLFIVPAAKNLIYEIDTVVLNAVLYGLCFHIVLILIEEIFPKVFADFLVVVEIFLYLCFPVVV